MIEDATALSFPAGVSFFSAPWFRRRVGCFRQPGRGRQATPALVQPDLMENGPSSWPSDKASAFIQRDDLLPPFVDLPMTRLCVCIGALPLFAVFSAQLLSP